METFKFVAGNARLMGGEIRFDIHPHPLDWIHFENALSIVSATQDGQPDSTRFLPMIPAARLQSTIRINFKKMTRMFQNSYFNLEFEHYWKQEHFYAAYGTESQRRYS
jgi:iron complex outermembrane receptor protein